MAAAVKTSMARLFYAPSIFSAEAGGSKIFRNVAKYLPDYTESNPRIQQPSRIKLTLCTV
jgi:hypothetical protein